MTPRQWTRVQQVFTEAIRMQRSTREAYVTRSCRSRAIRREVESLLEHHDKAENLLGVYSSVGGKVLSHYEIGERVGEGGMSLIYRARDTRLERWVVLKVLQPWAMGHAGFRERLVQEARCASALNHPNIVTVHGIAEENGVWFIDMEYVAGENLDALIPSNGFPVRTALDYSTQIAEALCAAEEAGILHGDLKPLNIMVTSRGQIKLLDFGLARALSAGQGRSQPGKPWSRFGTKAFMAPELLRDLRREPDVLSEIFSYGLVLQQMLGGKSVSSPPEGEPLPIALQARNSTAPPDNVRLSLFGILHRCLEKDPQKRFQSMRDLLEALQKCRAPTGRISVHEGRRAPDPKNPKVGRMELTASGKSDSADQRRVRVALSGIGYQNIAKTRKSLAELESILAHSPSPGTRDAVNSGLRDWITTADNFAGRIPAPVREVRKRALDVMRLGSQGELGRCFEDHDLEFLDLYGMNFAGEPLPGISFRGAFLVEANFEHCDLSGASFTDACVRNATFAGANLSGADFTNADWFNGLALTESQLKSVRPETLMDCPPSQEGMHRFLEARYALPFASWSTQVQNQLEAAWYEYLHPEGIRAVLIRRQRGS